MDELKAEVQQIKQASQSSAVDSKKTVSMIWQDRNVKIITTVFACLAAVYAWSTFVTGLQASQTILKATVEDHGKTLDKLDKRTESTDKNLNRLLGHFNIQPAK